MKISDECKAIKNSTKEPFLVEGQHVYRFGWHRLSDLDGNQGDDDSKYVTYRALRPAIGEQVVVVRDWKSDNKLSEEDLIKHGELGLGGQINIHWTGTNNNKSTWSAGCQVIRGQSYINSRKEPIDLTNFTAKTYADLYKNDKIDKGAYNILADLVVCYSKPNLDGQNPDAGLLHYTLGNEKETLPMIKTIFGESYVMDALIAMNADGVSA